ncbi:MAG: GNAT family N-acetyltransferase [Clostridiales bacterium]|nr:GNAT family N-acetyltransferase [Clostridiales bacterium]
MDCSLRKERGLDMLVKATELNREAILTYCNEEPSINLFIIGDIELYGFDTDFQEVWIQEKESKILGVVLKYHDNFIIYSKETMDYQEVVTLLSKHKVSVISGKATILNELYPLVKDEYNKKEMNFAELTDDRLLERNIQGVIKAAVEDAGLIAAAYGDIDEFKYLYSDQLEEREKQIVGRISSGEGIHMFIKEKDTILSHGNTAAETTTSAMIGGVMTHKDHRRKGLARMVVSALSLDLLSRGKHACLFYSNEASESLFKALGFKDIDKWIVLGGKNNE